MHALIVADDSRMGLAESVVPSLAYGFASADRMEESNSWRNPVDLIAILERTFTAIPTALEIGQGRRGSWAGRETLLAVPRGLFNKTQTRPAGIR